MSGVLKMIAVLLLFVAGMAVGGPPVVLEWSAGFSLPPQPDGRAALGVGAPFYGEHGGVALLAGGSNFPETPLVEGGRKRYYDEIYALPAGQTNWLAAGRLSRAVAEGMSATTAKGVVCVGGAADGETFARVFLLAWDAASKQAVETALPDFPCAVCLGAAAARGNRVYVAGGSGTEALATDIWMLDLDDLSAGWRPLPQLPGGKGRMQAQAFVQNGDQKLTYLFVVGGYAKHADGGWVALTDGYAYNLAQPDDTGVWQPIAAAVPVVKGSDAPPAAAWPLIGAKCVTVGDQHVLFFGGLDAAYFDTNQRKMASLTGAARETQRIAYQSAVPTTWNRNVLAYHTVTDRWFELGEVPFAPTVAGAAIKLADGNILLASGEVRPGVRTPLCTVGRFVARQKFHPVNWAVMGGYFLGLAVMGWWFMRKQKSADDYFKGGGRIPWWAAGISIFAAMFSSITFLAIPALAYMSNWCYAPKVLAMVLIPPLVIGCYLPFFRKLNLTCAYEYLELRFNLACRLFASLAFNLFMVARVAVVAYLPALAVAAATGADVNMCIVLVCLLTIVYCAVGGIEAVIWSDVIQGAVLLGGALLILVMLMLGSDGGIAGMVTTAAGAGKLRMIDAAFDFSRPVIWVVLIGGFAECLISYTSDQCVIQRYMTTRDVRAAGRSLWINVPMSLASGVIFFGIGTALFTYYRSHPQRLAVTMPKADSILPMFMTHELPVGVAGIVLAGLFAATITTLAANLNSSATTITGDWVVRLRRSETSDRAQVRIAQVCTVLIGLAGMAGALILANADIRAVYDQFLKFIGILTSGLACLFMLGIFVPRVGATAALCGLVANYVVCVGLDAAPLTWKPHLLLYGAIGIVTCLIVALAVSVVFPNRKEGIDGLVFSRAMRGEGEKS
jgi:cyclically-permuted mutarotase family protein